MERASMSLSPTVRVQPLTEQCSRVLQRREHALFGMSPCNSLPGVMRIRREPALWSCSFVPRGRAGRCSPVRGRPGMRSRR
ncbi:tRNA-dependent cyclodipeptide synthase [Streptomyces albidochromogenes]|uniref:Cyclodipeptide synthase n=1 Tax=Streptomyces albidochromogenes TaxID=329524 RepID=A0ABW6FH91_9ACTN